MLLPSTLQAKPPSTLGRFEVGAKIGGGGMATVYLGRERREGGTERLVALKVIREEFADNEEFAAMFVDEAKILARLSHPNVIQTLEYGVDQEHRFIAMELLTGRTSADVFEELVSSGDRFDLGVASWICARVAEGLHSAHEVVDEGGTPLNVIHRDVNPTNIFLTHAGEVKLIDFGLARARVRLSKTVDGVVKGKIPYLSPEQAHGRAIDRRTDIYALGTTLWEMATMKRLFKRSTDVATLLAIRDAHVPDPRDEDPSFPEELWRIIERALKRNADERYATAEEMRTDLDRFARTTGPHAPKVAALVERLFPGSEMQDSEWLRGAASVRTPALTMAPPAPVPIASSSLLDVEPSQGGKRISSRPSIPERVAEPVLIDETPPPPATRTPEVKPKGKKKPKKAKSREVASPPPEPKEDRRRLWMLVAIAVGVLILLAILTSR